MPGLINNEGNSSRVREMRKRSKQSQSRFSFHVIKNKVVSPRDWSLSEEEGGSSVFKLTKRSGSPINKEGDNALDKVSYQVWGQIPLYFLE